MTSKKGVGGDGAFVPKESVSHNLGTMTELNARVGSGTRQVALPNRPRLVNLAVDPVMLRSESLRDRNLGYVSNKIIIPVVGTVWFGVKNPE